MKYQKIFKYTMNNYVKNCKYFVFNTYKLVFLKVFLNFLPYCLAGRRSLSVSLTFSPFSGFLRSFVPSIIFLYIMVVTLNTKSFILSLVGPWLKLLNMFNNFAIFHRFLCLTSYEILSDQLPSYMPF